ncbi:MAG: hypothetical protein AAB468_02885 [Patescibacteria group bacterium]
MPNVLRRQWKQTNGWDPVVHAMDLKGAGSFCATIVSASLATSIVTFFRSIFSGWERAWWLGWIMFALSWATVLLVVYLPTCPFIDYVVRTFTAKKWCLFINAYDELIDLTAENDGHESWREWRVDEWEKVVREKLSKLANGVKQEQRKYASTLSAMPKDLREKFLKAHKACSDFGFGVAQPEYYFEKNRQK